MLEAVKLPARVSNLDTGLADVDRDALPHGAIGMVEQRREMGGGVKALGRRERRVRRRLPLRCSAYGFRLFPLGSVLRGFYLLLLNGVLQPQLHRRRPLDKQRP